MAALSVGIVLRHSAHTPSAALHLYMERALQRVLCSVGLSLIVLPAELCVVGLQDNRRLAKQFSSGHNEYGYGNQDETLASRRDSATRSAQRDQVRTSVQHVKHLTPKKCTACLHCPVICAASAQQEVMCTPGMCTALCTCLGEPLFPAQASTVRWALHHHWGGPFPKSCPQARSVLNWTCRPVRHCLIEPLSGGYWATMLGLM